MNPKYSRYYTYVKPILTNKTVKTYSPIVFSIITITIFALYAIRPTVKTILSLQKSIYEQNQILTQISQKSKSLSEGRKNYQQIDPQTKQKLTFLLPDSTNVPKLIENIYSLARTRQATVSGLQIQPVDLDGPPTSLSKNAPLKEIEFNLNIQGSFKQTYDFLSELQNQSRLISIQSVTMNKPQDGSLIMTINAKAYYFKN